MNSNPFLQYLENQSPSESKDALPMKRKEKNPFLEHLENEPSRFDEVKRQVIGYGSDMANVIAGAPAGIRDFLSDIYGYAEEKLPEPAGKVLSKGRELYEKSGAQKALAKLPTTKELEEKFTEKTQGKFKPQSEKESQGRELAQDIAGFFTPGTGKLGFAKRIAIPVAGFLTKQGIKELGGKQSEQELAKMGTTVVLSMVNPGGAKKHAANLFNKSEKMIPQGAMLDAVPIERALTPIKEKLAHGGSAPSKGEALKKIGEIEEKIQNGQMKVHDAVQFRKDINEVLERAGGFDVPKSERMSSIKNLNQVKSAILDGINDYGKVNKSFGKMNREANRSYAVIENSNRIVRNIEKTLQKPLKSGAMKALFGIAPYAGTAAAGFISPEYAALGAGAAGLYNSIKIIERMTKSPTLRSYYTNLVIAGLHNNAPSIARNAKKLDEAFLKEEATDNNRARHQQKSP